MSGARFHAYLAISLDGFIADADGDVDWLNRYQGDYGYDGFLAGVDTLIMGRATYDQVRTFGDWPYAGKRTFVVTSRPIPDAPDEVEGTSDLAGLIVELREDAAQVWIVGGAAALAGCRALGALDTLELFVMPELLGDGIALFADPAEPLDLTLASHRVFDDGVVGLVYDAA